MERTQNVKMPEEGKFLKKRSSGFFNVMPNSRKSSVLKKPPLQSEQIVKAENNDISIAVRVRPLNEIERKTNTKT